MFDRIKRAFGGGTPVPPPGPDLEDLEEQQEVEKPQEPPPEPEFYLGSAPKVDEKIEWTGNINEESWDLANYPGHRFATDPDTGMPNRILDGEARKVADIDAKGNVTAAETWFG